MRPTFDKLLGLVSKATSVPRRSIVPARRSGRRSGAVLARKILIVLCDRHLPHLSDREIGSLMGYTDDGTTNTQAHSVILYHRRRIQQMHPLNEPLLFEFVEQIESILADNGDSA